MWSVGIYRGEGGGCQVTDDSSTEEKYIGEILYSFPAGGSHHGPVQIPQYQHVAHKVSSVGGSHHGPVQTPQCHVAHKAKSVEGLALSQRYGLWLCKHMHTSHILSFFQWSRCGIS